MDFNQAGFLIKLNFFFVLSLFRHIFILFLTLTFFYMFPNSLYGFMYAFQQAGMTIASKFVGYLKDQGGWLALQMFFTILQLVGLGLSLYLISRIGLHSTTAGKKTAEDRTEEQIPMKEAEEKENTKEEN